MTAPTTVLLVDDDKEFLSSVSILLQKAGFACVTAEDGETGLHLAATQSPSVAVVDLDMPLVNGIEFARQIHDRELNVPIIIISGHSVLELPTTINTSGVAGFVQKPMRINELVEAIQAAVAADRSQHS